MKKNNHTRWARCCTNRVSESLSSNYCTMNCALSRLVQSGLRSFLKDCTFQIKEEKKDQWNTEVGSFLCH